MNTPASGPGLRAVFFAAMSAVLLATSALLGWLFLRDEGRLLDDELVTRAASVARTLASHAEYGVLTGEREGLGRLVEGLKHDPDLAWATIRDAEGVVLAEGPSGEDPRPGATSSTPLAARVPGVAVSRIEGPGGAWLVVEAPVFSAAVPRSREELGLELPAPAGVNEQVGAVTLVLSYTRREETLAASRRWVIALTTLVVALGVGLLLTAARGLIDPVLALAAASRRIAEGELHVRVEAPPLRELGELSNAFNHMASALEEREAALKEQAAELASQSAALKAANDALAAGNTELRLSQEQLHNINTELTRVSGQKSAFLASMSHELRTPLNSILGYTDCLLDGLDGPINDEQRDSLERVLRNGRHLLALINDVLDLSRIASGRMELKPVDVSLGGLAHECLEVVRPLLKGRRVELRAELAEPGLTARVDEGRLRQVVINLLSNAARLTQEGEIVVSVSSREGDVLLEVRDTGPGIPQARQEEIFEEFRQLEGGGEGTGLGLPISRRLTHLMGGKLTVQSVVGEGSTFTLQLPLGQAGA